MLTRETKKKLVALLKTDGHSFARKAFRFLLSLPKKQKAEIYSYILSNGLLCSKFQSCLYTTDLSRLGETLIYNDSIQTEDSFEHACFLMKLYSKKINRYIFLRSEYERLYLLGNFEDAEKILNVIDKEICISLWACGQHMLLQELQFGLTANKQLLDTYSHTAPNDYTTQYILFYYSSLAEENTSYNNYQNQIDKFFKDFPESAVKEYLAQKLSLSLFQTKNNLSLLIQVDSQYSIIDLYNDMELYIPYYFYPQIYSANLTEDYIKSFCSEIESPVARNISCLVSLAGGRNRTNNIANSVEYSLIEKYTLGDYNYVIEEAAKYLIWKPYDFQIAVIFCKALIHCGLEFPNDFPIAYVKCVFSIYSLNKDCKDSIASMQKYLKQNHGFSLRLKFQSFLARKDTTSYSEALVFSGLFDEVLHPNIVQFLSPELAKEATEYFAPVCHNAAILTGLLDAEHSIVIPKSFSASKIYTPFIEAELSCRSGEFQAAEKALLVAGSKVSIDDLYYHERLLRFRLKVLRMQNKHHDIINLLVDAFFINDVLFNRLLNGGKIEIPGRIRDNNILRDIDYVIYVYLTNLTNYNKQITAYTNFLEKNNFESIDQYLLSAPIAEDTKIRFFLEKICTLNLLKRDANLLGMNVSPETMRLKIIKTVYEIYPDKLLMDEINSISTSEVIRNNLRSINSSKINVDVEKIFMTFRNIWEENYRKYLQLSKSSAKIVSLDLSNESFKKRADNLNMMIASSADINQETLVLKGILEQILDACLYNTQYGLETYLSSRLRHGYCKEQLTYFLNELHLISLKDECEEQYVINDYWGNSLLKSPVQRSQVLEALGKFTKSIEQKIEQIRGEWIRIKNESNPGGMFDYSSFINAYLVNYQGEYIKEFQVFYNRVIDFFWMVTTKCLLEIRERIKEELQEYYIDAIAELELSISYISDDSTSRQIMGELKGNCALAKSKVITVIQEFQNVFSINKSEYKNFYMNDLTDSCKKIIEKLSPSSSNIQWNINADRSLLFDGKSFASFVDILCILLNNSISHSGYDTMSQIKIDVEIAKSTVVERTDFFDAMGKPDSCKHLMCLTVKNNLSPEISREELRNKLGIIFEEIKSERNDAQLIQSEGGSGLYKLVKTADYNIEAEYCIIFSVEDDGVLIGYEFVADKLIVEEESL